MPPSGSRNSRIATVSGSENGTGPANVSEQGFDEAPLLTEIVLSRLLMNKKNLFPWSISILRNGIRSYTTALLHYCFYITFTYLLPKGKPLLNVHFTKKNGLPIDFYIIFSRLPRIRLGVWQILSLTHPLKIKISIGISSETNGRMILTSFAP